ncbi:ABC transporter permease subunit, partial [bacterium]
MTADSPISKPLATRTAPNLFGRFLKNRMAWVGFALLSLLLILSILAPWIGKPAGPGLLADPSIPFPSGVDNVGVPHAPGDGFFIGADTLGRDVWTQGLYGARVSLTVAFCAMITSTLLGTVIGLVGGYFGGRTDRILTRFTEIISSLPTILLAITLAKVLPQYLPDFWLFKKMGIDPNLSFFRLLLAIGLVTWTGIARAVRG